VQPAPDLRPPAAISDIAIVPNPVADRANISFMLAAPNTVQISVFDLRGIQRLVVPPINCNTEGRWQFGIDLSSLPPGIYILTVTTKSGALFTRRFGMNASTGK
jgi:hypothetical protein